MRIRPVRRLAAVVVLALLTACGATDSTPKAQVFFTSPADGAPGLPQTEHLLYLLSQAGGPHESQSGPPFFVSGRKRSYAREDAGLEGMLIDCDAPINRQKRRCLPSSSRP